jgi:hypothetical protein
VDEKATRIANLRAVLDARFEGNKSAMSRALGQERPAYVIDLLNGKKSFGEKAARTIETALGLARGELDVPPSSGKTPKKPALRILPHLSDEAVSLAEDWQQLEEPMRSQVLAMVASLAAEQRRQERANRRKGRSAVAGRFAVDN